MVDLPEITCLCGAVNGNVRLRPYDPYASTTLDLCHCSTCRYSSGTLWTSYHPISEPTLSENLRKFATASGSIRYFCGSCGCHVFRSKANALDCDAWEVATGVVVNSIDKETDNRSEIAIRHWGIDETGDGGGSVWLPTSNTLTHGISHSAIIGTAASPSGLADSLPGSCICGAVQFHLTRPGPSSNYVHSYYPDLMYAYATTPHAISSNPDHEKWWIKDDKYMAGTCACRSCRLSSGFEIQTWAFVPRVNILMSHFTNDKGIQTLPLDFRELSGLNLSTYSSSPGVERNFCSNCGATVFWHDTIRPDLIDVSAGLLRAPEGARAKSWLHWWPHRVSFEEETENGRYGEVARVARKLVNELQAGLKNG